MAIRGRGSGLGQGRGRNPPQHSPDLPSHIGVQNNQHKRQRLYKSSDSEERHEYYIYDGGANHRRGQSDANNVKKCKGVSFEFSNNMRQLSGGIRHSQRRGQSDPPEPSQSCTSPAPPPPHMSFSPGVNNDKNKRQTEGLTGADARKGTTYTQTA
ncbi:uncharacterized protein LOC123898676 isoform X1 [Trifolium pratense]|uniref:uncharacterized protein LOC123898676 isoform X1 n=1 Tax=Trifolium pratense TaxID=57577 RepID=UPI001E697C8A|nr:uncharacterized protein LOC123898676 isoform X1 [Trifolium pratense]